MLRFLRKAVISSMILLSLVTPAWPQITPIAPFTGTHFDNFNNIGPGGSGGFQQIDVFNGFATVVNTTAGGALKLEFSSMLGSDLVVPRSPPLIFGQIGISEWTFDLPISRFGGYWENNSRFDNAVVQFFDSGNNLIGSTTATVPRFAQAWTWNGWQSTTPISKLTVTGNDVEFLNGFIWWEDFNVTVASVPEPGTWALLGLACLAAGGYVIHRRKARHAAINDTHEVES